MATELSITLTLGFTGTDFKRKYKFNGVTQNACTTAAAKIKAYNANVPAADKKVFISDDYDDSDPNNIVGEFASIVAAQYEAVEYTKIPLN